MNYRKNNVNIIGCGYSGIECALFLAGHGIKVNLFDWEGKHKFNCMSCNHRKNITERREAFDVLLKKELAFLGSPLIRQEEYLKSQGFKGCVEGEIYNLGLEMVKNNENIEYFNFPINEINSNEINIIASGSTTNDALSDFLTKKLGSMKCFKYKYKYPIIDNIDLNNLEKDGDNYYLHINYGVYIRFINQIVKEINNHLLQGNFSIMEKSIEDLVCKGKENLRNYALMPVIIGDLKEKPYATVSLRKVDEGFLVCGIASNFNEFSQIEILRTLPGFENAILIQKSKVKKGLQIYPKYTINEFGQSKVDKNLFFTGSILGFEDYAQSIASGLSVAMAVNNYYKDRALVSLHQDCLIGYISKKILSTNLLKSNDILQDYDIMNKQDDFTNEKLIGHLFEKSINALALFKEEYINGKHV